MSDGTQKLKSAFAIAALAAGAAFVGLRIAAKAQKAASIYENAPEEKNPLEGKKVIFVEDENDKENADGAKGHLEAIGDSDHQPGVYEKYVKRGIDLVLSFGGLVALSPVFAAISLAIKIEDPGPVLFTQKRMGQNKQYFKLHKFRSMRLDTPHDVPTHQLSNPEQYITKTGKFIRAHSLDELPQIWDIFIGNMSVIGPRPGLWNQDLLTAERDKYNANDIKPGLTGWAQINGRDELEIPEKARLDGEYVQNLSPKMDLKCFLGSLGVFVHDDSVVEGGTGQLNKQDANKISGKRILVICQHYKPEPFRVSDYCEALAKEGHEVHVVTGYPNYPEGVIYDGYGSGKHIDEVIDGVYVHRCFTVPRGTGAVKRMVNYYSFAASSTAYVLSKNCVASDGKSFDIVYCNQLSPVMMADAAIAYKKKHHVPAVLYCLDLWPESLIAGGIQRNSPIYRYYRHVSRNIYRQMDKILVTSRLFSDYLQQFGIEANRISYLPQYAEGLFDQLPAKEENGTFDFLFAGNIGAAQSVETIIECARLLQSSPARFHIVGSGSSFEQVKLLANGLDNVVFYGRRPVEDMPEFYAKADALLVTLASDPVLSLTLPGKVQSYMASGKPIIGSIDGEAQIVIRDAECGFCSAAGDAQALAANIRRFMDPATSRTAMGENARRYYEENFRQELFLKKLKHSLGV